MKRIRSISDQYHRAGTKQRRLIGIASYFFFLTLLASACMSERLIRLDPGFLKASDRVSAERKDFPFARFEFGDYRIPSEGVDVVETKPGRDVGELLASEWTAFEEAEFRFTLVGNQRDTVQTRASITRWDHFRDSPVWNENELIHQVDSFSATFSVDSRDVPWVLTIVLHKRGNVEGVRSFWGTLTNGVTAVEVQEVHEWSDGEKDEKSLVDWLGPEAQTRREDTFGIGSWLGYKFSLDGRTIGAVQVSPSEFHRRMFWLRKDLSGPLKLVLANVAGALFLRSEKYIEQMENLGWVRDQ